MSARESDRRARRAFQELALRAASRERYLFDFGAGPGLDAKHYAAHGQRVLAYDIDPVMCSALERHCAAEIACGQVRLYRDSYPAFLQQAHRIGSSCDIGLGTANFAPLNLVLDLQELFAGLHALTGHRATVIAAVLNPNFIADLRYRWWWSHRTAYWRDGFFGVRGSAMTVYRHSVRRFAAAAAPYFKLESLERAPNPLARRYLNLVFSRR